MNSGCLMQWKKNELTEIATSLPDDYSVWWAGGGFVVGVLTTVIITYAVSK